MNLRSSEEIEHLERILETFRRKGGGRKYKEAEQLLKAFGFKARKTGRNHVLWKRGRLTLTLPPHQALKLPYVKRLIRIVERSLEPDG